MFSLPRWETPVRLVGIALAKFDDCVNKRFGRGRHGAAIKHANAEHHGILHELLDGYSGENSSGYFILHGKAGKQCTLAIKTSDPFYEAQRVSDAKYVWVDRITIKRPIDLLS